MVAVVAEGGSGGRDQYHQPGSAGGAASAFVPKQAQMEELTVQADDPFFQEYEVEQIFCGK